MGNMKSSFIEELSWREFIFQKTPGIEKAFKNKTTIYFGTDLTGDSLHIGHLLGCITLKRAYDFGNNIIILLAGGTTRIGDPSGKDEERPILPEEEILKNKEKLKKQFLHFFNFNDKQVKVVDNNDWLSKLGLIEFLRDAGKYISINSMMDKDSVKSRLLRKQGMSYAEFSYQLLQAYDFLHFFKTRNCNVQIAGSDQWGNMIQGVELVRKKLNKQVYALSWPLITDSKTGKKYGKTEKGAPIWLDKEKTHPFAFYQFFINQDDSIIGKLIRYYSFKSKHEIEELERKWKKQKHIRLLQKELAYEMTMLVHGKEIANQCKRVACVLFEKETADLKKEDIDFAKKAVSYKKIVSEKDFVLEQILVDLKLALSKGEARRLIQQGGVKTKKIFNKYYLIRKGKKEWGIVEISS